MAKSGYITHLHTTEVIDTRFTQLKWNFVVGYQEIIFESPMKLLAYFWRFLRKFTIFGRIFRPEGSEKGQVMVEWTLRRMDPG